MDEYGINIHTEMMGTVRYRLGGDRPGVRLPLLEAETRAYELMQSRHPIWVSIGNGQHEFRLWAEDAESRDSGSNFNRPGLRWADWYVDVEINNRRWRYKPLADLDDYHMALVLASEMFDIRDSLGDIYIGASDGDEEFVQTLGDDS